MSSDDQNNPQQTRRRQGSAASVSAMRQRRLARSMTTEAVEADDFFDEKPSAPSRPDANARPPMPRKGPSTSEMRARRTTGEQRALSASEARARRATGQQRALSQDEARARRATREQRALSQDEARARRATGQQRALSQDEARARRATGQQRALSQDEARARRATGQQRALSPEEARARRATGQRRTLSPEEARARRATGQRRALSPEEARAKQANREQTAKSSSEVRARRSAEPPKTASAPEIRARRAPQKPPTEPAAPRSAPPASPGLSGAEASALMAELRKLQKEIERLKKEQPRASAAPPSPGGGHDEGHGASEEMRELLPEDWGIGESKEVSQEAVHQRNRIDFFLQLMIDRGASDFHLHVGNSPIYRQSGQIAPMRYRPLRQGDWERMVRPICPPSLWESFVQSGDVDFAYEIPGLARFRVNLMRQHRGDGAVFRVIPSKIMTLDQLGMPPQLGKLAEESNGLVLITGPTGSGKSTTLAALIDSINRNKKFHIITIEDPIEFVHTPNQSLIHQREIGAHSATFYEALMAAMREDPDLILVGEMRDRETIGMALQAAEKGMLVYGTLHTNSAAKTIDRIINAFPADEQDQVRTVLAGTLRGVVSQQLLRRVGGGRVAALEILFCTRAAANLIREGKAHQLPSLMQTGIKEGMVQMDQSLNKLMEEGIITREAALEKAIDKSLFKDPDAKD